MWDYRVVGININNTSPADSSKASKKLEEKLSVEFLEREFPQEYIENRSINIALQCQQVIQIYGKKGWEHYQQGQLGNNAMLYFRKEMNNSNSQELTIEEKTMITKLDPLQQP